MEFSNCVLLLHASQTTNEAVFAVEFNPIDSSNIITCGKSHIYFWTLSSGQVTKKQGIFGVRPPPNTKLTAALRLSTLLLSKCLRQRRETVENI